LGVVLAMSVPRIASQNITKRKILYASRVKSDFVVDLGVVVGGAERSVFERRVNQIFFMSNILILSINLMIGMPCSANKPRRGCWGLRNIVSRKGATCVVRELKTVACTEQNARLVSKRELRTLPMMRN
jgi:hypothetical protein